MQANSLLAHDDGPDVSLRRIFQQVVDRIAAEDLDPLPLHDFSDRVSDFHLTGLPPSGLQTELTAKVEARLRTGNRRMSGRHMSGRGRPCRTSLWAGPPS